MSANSRRGLFGRRQQIERATPAQLATLTDAFFACESRMGEIAPAVRASRATAPGRIPQQDWDALRDQYDELISTYLTLSAADSPAATPAAVQACIRSFETVSEAMNRFRSVHQRALYDGHEAMTAASHAEQQAQTAATRALAAFDQAPLADIGLSSVRAAADRMTRATTRFEAASGIVERRQTGDELLAAATDLEQRLAQAPALAGDADRTVRSLRTRAEAITTRLAAVPRVISQLLRDFSAECSDDLVSTPDDVRADLAAAGELLDRAGSLLSSAPDESLDAAEAARIRLTHADDELDRVFDRLADLRTVRADPDAESGRVRFRVRDAQNFALAHGLVGEWGSVLDAQGQRIDRAGATLQRIHPDYWTYLTELRAVDQRITEIIARMRDQVARP